MLRVQNTVQTPITALHYRNTISQNGACSFISDIFAKAIQRIKDLFNKFCCTSRPITPSMISSVQPPAIVEPVSVPPTQKIYQRNERQAAIEAARVELENVQRDHAALDNAYPAIEEEDRVAREAATVAFREAMDANQQLENLLRQENANLAEIEPLRLDVTRKAQLAETTREARQQAFIRTMDARARLYAALQRIRQATIALEEAVRNNNANGEL